LIKSNFALAIIEDLEGEVIPGYQTKLKFNIISSKKSEELVQENIKLFQKSDKILNYKENYYTHSKSEFIKNKGDAALQYINQTIISKQRGIIGYFLKKLGSNLFQGQSIMNISLPINIFDERSLLEVFAHQNSLAPYFLEKAGQETNKLEKLKLTTTYALTMLHLSVTQLKPFNPILGETFQAKIGKSTMFLEQTSHHPPRCNFYLLGNYYKAYGYQEPVASTGTNSVNAKSSGYHYVHYPDGVKHKIYGPALVISGTIYGNRSFNFVDKMYIVDEANDLISVISFNPDERGFFKKNGIEKC